jgi:hypothetical protein
MDTHSTNNKKRSLDIFEDNNVSMITLNVRISCDTFWNYSYNIPVYIKDFYDKNTRNINNNRNRVSNVNISSSTCEIGNIGHTDPMFEKLETYLIDYVLEHIYEDITRNRMHHRELPLLLKKARKFHIHGRTLEDILFPDTSAIPENIVYICTHC